MPKFGNIWFNGYYFGDDRPPYVDFKKAIGRIELGLNVRKQLGKRIIFRVQGKATRYPLGQTGIVQDKYKYFVPSSINNPEGNTARQALATAVSNWKNVLTQEQKQEYNNRARKKRFLSGYNLYIGEYIKANA